MKNITIIILFALFLSSCTKQEKSADTSSKEKESTGGVQGSRTEEITFESKSLKKSYKDCKPKDENCTWITVDYDIMAAGKSKEQINKSIIDSIAKTIFIVEEGTPFPPIEEGMSSFIKDYEDYIKDFPELNMPWSSETAGKSVYFNDKILSYSISTSSFTGGAHPNSYLQYYNFDLSTGKILNLSDLLKPGYEKKLNEIIDKKYREKNKLTASESLQAAGLFENSISFNDNFAVTKEGLLFYYNNYEIASYAAGPTELLITYSELNDLISENSLLK